MKQLPIFHLGVSAPLREIILNAMRYWACRADLAEGSQ
jgi:hypothetical protein